MPRTRAANIRQLILTSHRWLGLAASIVLTVVGATGAVIAWPRSGPRPRMVGAVHEALALGSVGHWVVVAVTIASVLLQLGGVFLWWKQKTLWVRPRAGWRRAVNDIHHILGVLTFPVMFVVGATGVGMSFMAPRDHPVLRPLLTDLHSTRKYSAPVKLVYAVSAAGFVVQGASGVVMWWSSRAPRRRPRGSLEGR